MVFDGDMVWKQLMMDPRSVNCFLYGVVHPQCPHEHLRGLGTRAKTAIYFTNLTVAAIIERGTSRFTLVWNHPIPECTVVFFNCLIIKRYFKQGHALRNVGEQIEVIKIDKSHVFTPQQHAHYR